MIRIPKELLHDREKLMLAIENLRQHLRYGYSNTRNRLQLSFYEDYLYEVLDKKRPEIPDKLFNDAIKMEETIKDLKDQLKYVRNKRLSKEIQRVISAYEKHYYKHLMNVNPMRTHYQNYNSAAQHFPIPIVFPKEEQITQHPDRPPRYYLVAAAGKPHHGVYKGWDSFAERDVTIKEFFHNEEGVLGFSAREISILKDLNHKNIVTLQNILQSTKKVFLVYEFLETDLKTYMNSIGDKLDVDFVKIYLRQILEGINHCHSRQIIHRDLKPRKLFLDSAGNLKIFDFRQGRVLSSSEEEYTSDVVTLWYRAPEILLGHDRYGTPVDIWSIGCIFAEMCLGRVVFPGDSEIGQLFTIFQKLGTPSEESWPGVTKYTDFRVSFPKWRPNTGFWSVMEECMPVGYNLLQQMLCFNPAKRISARRALKHPFLCNKINEVSESKINQDLSVRELEIKKNDK